MSQDRLLGRDEEELIRAIISSNLSKSLKDLFEVFLAPNSKLGEDYLSRFLESFNYVSEEERDLTNGFVSRILELRKNNKEVKEIKKKIHAQREVDIIKRNLSALKNRVNSETINLISAALNGINVERNLANSKEYLANSKISQKDKKIVEIIIQRVEYLHREKLL